LLINQYSPSLHTSIDIGTKYWYQQDPIMLGTGVLLGIILTLAQNNQRIEETSAKYGAITQETQ